MLRRWQHRVWLGLQQNRSYICFMEKAKKLVRFDWAMKKLLRHKANFGILEGFLSELLHDNIKIIEILDSESNKETKEDKFNRVDILVKDEKDQLIIIEIQNTRQYDYFQRMLYGASKTLSEHIKQGDEYLEVKKIISVNIVYFDLGQGNDYVYHGTTVFHGLNKPEEVLALSEKQKATFQVSTVKEIFPEYWVIKVNKFDNHAKNTLDEWVYFFKNGSVKTNFTAKGLIEAQKKLDVMKLSAFQRRDYDRYLIDLMDNASWDLSLKIDRDAMRKELKEEVREEVKEEVKEAVREEVLDLLTKELAQKALVATIFQLTTKGKIVEEISDLLDIPTETVREMIKLHRN
jgi:predicted transposase/invertase (TIGR01784 family)